MRGMNASVGSADSAFAGETERTYTEIWILSVSMLSVNSMNNETVSLIAKCQNFLFNLQ